MTKQATSNVNLISTALFLNTYIASDGNKILGFSPLQVPKCGCVQFEMDIDEMGTEFTETVEVDDEANTERYVVPQHNDAVGATYLHDFNLVSLLH